MFIFTEGVNGAGIDSVGTVPASLITFASIQALQPDILINAGTCGAFKVLPFFTFSFQRINSSLYLCVCVLVKLVKMPCLLIFQFASLTHRLNSHSIISLLACCGSWFIIM